MTGSFIPASFLGYDASLDGTYGYDPERAMALLEEAGWRDEDGNGIREAYGVEGVEDGTPLMINFLATNAFAMHFTLAEFAQAMLSEIGIGGTVELVDWPTRTQRRLDVRPWEIQADGLGQSITDPSFMDIYFHSTKGQWPARMKFAMPEVDELLDRALASYDDEERAALYNEVDRIMLEEVFFVNVWRREQGEAMQPYVMNFEHTFGANSYLTLPEVWLDR
jgi:peptide/nickel transport system substrate-binding protein